MTILFLGCILISFFAIYYVLDASTNSQIQAANDRPIYSIDVQVYPNPDTINTFKNASLDVYIRNKGNVNNTIQDIQLILPAGWDYMPKEMLLLNLPVNRTLQKHFDIVFTPNVLSGKYKVGILVNTERGDYMAFPEITVEGFDTITVSGDKLPVWIFIIIVSGIVTYVILLYTITRKFETNYIAAGILTVGLGLLNWFIVRIISGFNQTPDFYENITSTYYTIGVGVLTGFGGYGIFKLFKWMKEGWNDFWNNILQDRKERMTIRRGTEILNVSDDSWLDFISAIRTYVIEKMGKIYSISVRVYLKPNESRFNYVDGILRFSQKTRPTDIVLYPKRLIHVENREKILEVLEFNNNEIVKAVLGRDRTYRRKLSRHLFKGATEIDKAALAQRIVEVMRKRMNDKNDNKFIEFMEEIDFSRYVVDVVNKLGMEMKETKNTIYKMEMKYGGPTFVPFETIYRMEIIAYESRYAIHIDDKNQIIPPPYRISEIFPTMDKTID